MFRTIQFLLIGFTISSFSFTAVAQDEFTFDISSYDKKPYEFGGYLEFVTDRQWLNSNSAAYKLNSSLLSGQDIIDHQLATAELTGQYQLNSWQFSFNAHAVAENDNLTSENDTQLYEGIIAYKPEPGFTFEIGKKALSWGKGYAWNPVGFLQRPKNPDEPESSREGYSMATLDIIQSYSGDLKTLAFTPVYLPVTEEINTDFSRVSENYYALKLYLLYKDTDIDFIYQSGASRSERLGFDFSRNITTNFEIHGEWAYLSGIDKMIVDNVGEISKQEKSANQWLLGFRYLTDNDTTLISEYYKNEAGYSSQEMTAFFNATSSAYTSANTALLSKLSLLSQQTYLKRNPAQQYLYLRLSNKEPFSWLYFTPSITVIKNLDDNSYSTAIELVYTGFNNIEMRAKASWLTGNQYTEFDEKMNEQKLEFRLRYFF